MRVTDLLLGGKFKNRKVIVEDIGENELNQPTINGKPLLKFRINKQLPEGKKKEANLLESLTKLAEVIPPLPSSITDYYDDLIIPRNYVEDTPQKKPVQPVDKTRPLLDLIAKGEGTSDATAKKYGLKSGYDSTFGHGIFNPSDRPITDLTLSELKEFQKGMLGKQKGKKLRSTAVGRYQILQNTLGELQKKLGIPDTEKFTPELQDKFAKALLKRRGLDKYLSGKMSAKQFQNRLANEWASIAKHGLEKGSYEGQPAPTKTTAIQKALSTLASNDKKSVDKTSKLAEMIQIDPVQLLKGIKVETEEHHAGPVEGAKIALDHLMEVVDYYDKLPKVEEEGEETPEEAKAGMSGLQGDMEYKIPESKEGQLNPEVGSATSEGIKTGEDTPVTEYKTAVTDIDNFTEKLVNGMLPEQ